MQAAEDFPIVDVGREGGWAAFQALPERTRALRQTALESLPFPRWAANILNARSRAWLDRTGNPYGAEIHRIADAIGEDGIYILNLVYDWACSTSAGPAPDGLGNRLVRILDWGMPGIGPFSVLNHHRGPAGPFVSAGWPAYCGVLTGMAPGRFSAAINKGAIEFILGKAGVDEMLAHFTLLFEGRSMPPEHLLRQVFETAPDYATARRMLEDTSVRLTRPVIFTLSGTAPGEGCVIEGRNNQRATRAIDSATPQVAAANDWYISGWRGHPHAYASRGDETPAQNNSHRRGEVSVLNTLADPGWDDCPEPLRNRFNVHFVVADARRGWLRAEALDSTRKDGLRRVLGPTVIQM
jgi:hypothetical protein